METAGGKPRHPGPGFHEIQQPGANTPSHGAGQKGARVTHGERWRAKAIQRMRGYCITRGWHMSVVVKVGSQWQFDVRDSCDNTDEIAFGMTAEKCWLIDEYGISPDYLSAALFESMLPNLKRKTKSAAKQLVVKFRSGEGPYRMCAACADHNIRNRGAKLVGPYKSCLSG